MQALRALCLEVTSPELNCGALKLARALRSMNSPRIRSSMGRRSGLCRLADRFDIDLLLEMQIPSQNHRACSDFQPRLGSGKESRGRMLDLACRISGSTGSSSRFALFPWPGAQSSPFSVLDRAQEPLAT